MHRLVEHDVVRDAIALVPECQVSGKVDKWFQM